MTSLTCRKVNMEMRVRNSNEIFIKLLIICIYVDIVASAKLLCADTECTKLIAEGRTVNIYPSPKPEILSLKANKQVKIFGKLKDDDEYYLLEIDGKKGFAPIRFIEERKIITKNLIDVSPEKFGWKQLPNKFNQQQEISVEKKISFSPFAESDGEILQGSTVSSNTFSKSNVPDEQFENQESILKEENDNIGKFELDDTFTVDDLNQYSVSNNKLSKEQQPEKLSNQLEHKTSDKISDQKQQITDAHQELNIHSSTIANDVESHHAHISPPPSISDLHSIEDQEKLNSESITGVLVASRSLLSTDETRKSCSVIEGTHICDENPTASSDSVVINEQTPSVMNVYNSLHLHPSTVSSESDVTSNNEPTPASTDTYTTETVASESTSSLKNSVSLSESTNQNLKISQGSEEKHLYATSSVSIENKPDSTISVNSISSISVENKPEQTISVNLNSEHKTENNQETDIIESESESHTTFITSNEIENTLDSETLSENSDTSNKIKSDFIENLKAEDINTDSVINNSNNQSILSKVVSFAKNVLSTINSEIPENSKEENINDDDDDDIKNIEEEEEKEKSYSNKAYENNNNNNKELEHELKPDMKHLEKENSKEKNNIDTENEKNKNNNIDEKEKIDLEIRNKQNNKESEHELKPDMKHLEKENSKEKNNIDTENEKNKNNNIDEKEKIDLEIRNKQNNKESEHELKPDMKHLEKENSKKKNNIDTENEKNKNNNNNNNNIDEKEKIDLEIRNKQNNGFKNIYDDQPNVKDYHAQKEILKRNKENNLNPHEKSIKNNNMEEIQDSKTVALEIDRSKHTETVTESLTSSTKLNSDIENKKLESQMNEGKKSIENIKLENINDDTDLKIESENILLKEHKSDESLPINDKNEIESVENTLIKENSFKTSEIDKIQTEINIPIGKSKESSLNTIQEKLSLSDMENKINTQKESAELKSESTIEINSNLNIIKDMLDPTAIPDYQEKTKQVENNESEFLSKNIKIQNSKENQETISENSITANNKILDNSEIDSDIFNENVQFNSEITNSSENMLKQSINLSSNITNRENFLLKSDDELSEDDQNINLEINKHDSEKKKDIESTETESLLSEEEDMIVTSKIETTTRSILNFNEEVDYGDIEEKKQNPFDIISEETKEYVGFLPFLEIIIDMLPGQVQKKFSEWEIQGLSPRVTVVTFMAGILTLVVYVFTIYIQRNSKESYLIGKLGIIEQKMFTVKTERDILKEELDTTKHQFGVLQKNLLDQRNITIPLQKELDETKNQNSELKNRIDMLNYQLEEFQKDITSLQNLAQSRENKNTELIESLEENEKIKTEMEQNLKQIKLELSEEKQITENLKLSNENLTTQLSLLETNCKQLLQEAQLWNERVSELTGLLEVSKQNCDELQDTMKLKETELQGIKKSIKEIKILEEIITESDDGDKKLQQLFDVSLIQEQLRELKEEKDLLYEKYTIVNETLHRKEEELLESKEEIEKLKMNYNQALQDKMEAQTKLDVLSNYFKEKELQLQKELGVQEAMRQQKEEVASSASQHIALIKQENISYKNQLAALKQELEDTERNYKNQVATQEKKAHENWLAARLVERKLEDVKQESSQLRQRLTLLEREQDTWTKSQIDGVVRPVPKRYLDPNGEVPFTSKSLDSVELPNSSTANLPSRGVLELNKMTSAENPMLLPVDRPLPPPPPPMLKFMDPRFPLPPPPPPPFMHHPPPFNEHMPPHPAPPSYLDPWRFPPPPLPPMHRRMSPPDFDRSHLSATPQDSMSPPLYDREMDKHSVTSRDTIDRHLPSDRYSPPMPRDPSSRDSHSSSPPRLLPRFHDNPPPKQYGYPPPPPVMTSRFASSSLRRRDPSNFPSNVPLDQRSVDHRSGEPVTSSPRHIRQQTPPDAKSNTATAV